MVLYCHKCPVILRIDRGRCRIFNQSEEAPRGRAARAKGSAVAAISCEQCVVGVALFLGSFKNIPKYHIFSRTFSSVRYQ